MRWAGYVAGKGEKRNAYTILMEKPDWKRSLGRPRRMWADIIKMNLRENGMIEIGLIWLRIGTSGGLLWTQKWTFGFHKMLGSSWVAEQLAASQEGLSSMSDENYVFIIHPLLIRDWLRAGRQRGRNSSSGRVKNFLFSTSSRPTLGSTQPPIKWVPGVLPRA
jgi:hypothetical protein